jgi:hypothetical protein
MSLSSLSFTPPPPPPLPPRSLPSPRSPSPRPPQDTRKLLFNAKNMLEQLQDELASSKRAEEELRALSEEQQYALRSLEGQVSDLEGQVRGV